MYAKLIKGVVEYAPKNLRIGNTIFVSPTDEQYLSAGYKPVVESAPETDAGHYAVPARWEETDSTIVRVYEVHETAPVVRTISVARLIYWVTERGTYETLKAVLGESLMMQAVALGEFREDNEDFLEVRPTLVEAFGEDTVAAAIDYATEG